MELWTRRTLVAFAISFLIFGAGWLKVALHGRWLSAPHRVVWVGPDGKPIITKGPYAFAGCHGDIHAGMIVDGSRAWVICERSDYFPEGALGLIDLDRKTGKIAWPFPAAVEWTEGILLGPKGQLAIVSFAKDARVVGIAGPDGWLQAPIALPTGGDAGKLLGMAFDGATLEVVTLRWSDDAVSSRTPQVTRVVPGRAPETRGLSPDRIRCAVCGIQAAYKRSGAPAWRFIETNFEQARQVVLDAAEDGPSEVAGLHQARLIPLELDLTWTGVLSAGYSLKEILQGDGRFRPIEPAPVWSHEIHDMSKALIRSNDRLERVPQWFMNEATPAFAHRVDGRVLVVRKVEEGSAPNGDDWVDERLVIDEGENGHRTPIARLNDCTELWDAPLFARDGGYLLISPTGCYVELGRDLARRDPQGIIDHLRMRGSMYLTWNEWWQPWKLAFVLFALPVLLLLARASGKTRWRKVMGYAPWVYVIVGGYALVTLWPLMR